MNGEYEEYEATPPPNRKIRNPFDKALIGSLHMPICSPGMCKIYKRQADGSFRWEIDEASNLVPADIVACNSQFEPTPDPVLEKIAEEANDKFFSQNLVIPSPIESSKKVRITSIDLLVNNFNSDNEETTTSFSTREVSSQTVLTLPPVLPPEVESVLAQFCTHTQDQNLCGEYVVTANRRQLLFEEHADMGHYDSEQTDDESPKLQKPLTYSEQHSPIRFSPDMACNISKKGMSRYFGTPLSKVATKNDYKNKILDAVDIGEPCFSPIFRTPQRTTQGSITSSSLASISISPVTKMTSSSDEEKNNFSSPESEAMATCLDCVSVYGGEDRKENCICKITPNKSLLKRSSSLKDSSWSRSRSFSEKRSTSMSSLNRSKSVQKLDFSLDMSVDSVQDDHIPDLRCHSVLAGSDSSASPSKCPNTWSIEDEASMHKQIKTDNLKPLYHEPFIFGAVDINRTNILDETPIKTKTKAMTNARTHVLNKIRSSNTLSPEHNMSLDSIDSTDNPLGLEDRKVDFNNIEFKFLSNNTPKFDFSSDIAKIDNTGSFRRLDSGYENTFYTNASGYYESAIKPSELTVTDGSKCDNPKRALREISNVTWMRVDSGFKDENSTDSMNFYPSSDNSMKKFTQSSDVKMEDKENVDRTDDFDRLLGQATTKNELMSISEIFSDDITFNCNFSSTPSKNKIRSGHS